MKTRIITAIVAICVFIPIIVLSGTVVFPIALGIVTVISLYEMCGCIGAKKLYITLPLYIAGFCMPFLMRYLVSSYIVCMIGFVFAAIYLFYLFTISILSHGKFNFPLLSSVFFASLYIIVAFMSILYVRDFGSFGKYIYLLIFTGAWVTDTFAYFTGVLLGKHKLIPEVSPKKTVEGSIGGMFFCVLSFIIFGLIMQYMFNADANIVFLAVGGFFISIISQVGDLIMSVIKRHYGIKDYGKIFPGHGGMLDRFDSVLAVSLGMCVLCMIASIAGINIL